MLYGVTYYDDAARRFNLIQGEGHSDHGSATILSDDYILLFL